MFLFRHTAGSNLTLMPDHVAILLISTNQGKSRMSGMLWSDDTRLAASMFCHVQLHPA